MKKIKKGTLLLIIIGIVLALGIICFFITVAVDNKKEKKYEGSITSPNDKFSLILNISKSWTNDEGTENQTEGQQFDFTIIDETTYNLNNWNLVININVPGYNLKEIDDAWNVEYVKDGNTLNLTPVGDIDLVSISRTKNNSFGFIFINNIKVEEKDFSNITYTLTGIRHKDVMEYKTFWILFFALIIYVAYAISYIVIRLKERNFEAFKENTYKIINQSMNTFASLIDTKDPYTKDHSARVSYYSVKIARKLGLDDDFIRNLAYIALMHDCGKLLIDDDILTKPAKLTEEEYEIMKTHTSNGGKALQNFTSIKEIVNGAMYHHEWYDGTGYPKGLKGEEIPLSARIIGVADSLDAMASDRCYRAHLEKEEIIKELEDNSGTQFDPKIAKVAIEMVESGEINIYDNIRKDAD
ncbi:MAG: HD domain-containing protein [Acholeplasmatales bacterium]|nr:HD domain-containing protein [Acholeplasmatales bacterium]